MAVSIAPYEVVQFNALPKLKTTGAKFDAKDGYNFVQEVMKPLFRDYGVQNNVGLSLMHKHFDLEAGERLTDVRGTSNPLTFECVSPTIWGFTNNDIRPMEFSLGQTKPLPSGEKFDKFLTALHATLKRYNLLDILGLCIYPGDGYLGSLEVTVGKANVNLTPEEGKKFYPEGSKRDVRWFFTDYFIEHGCKCQCKDNKDHTHGGHYTVVSG